MTVEHLFANFALWSLGKVIGAIGGIFRVRFGIRGRLALLSGGYVPAVTRFWRTLHKTSSGPQNLCGIFRVSSSG
jgi:hypothetical protein